MPWQCLFSSGIVLYFIFESLIGGDFEFSKHRDFTVKARIVDMVILVTFVIPIIVHFVGSLNQGNKDLALKKKILKNNNKIIEWNMKSNVLSPE